MEQDVVKEEPSHAGHEEAVAATRLREEVAAFDEFGGEEEFVELADVVTDDDDVHVVEVVGQLELLGRSLEELVGDVVARSVLAFAHDGPDVLVVCPTVAIDEVFGKVLLQSGSVGAEPPRDEAGPDV